MDHWLHHTAWLGNSAHAWVIAGIGALIGYIVVYAVARFIAARLKALSARRPRSMLLHMCAAVADATRGWVLLLLAVLVALHSLHFTSDVDDQLRWLVGAKGTVNGRLGWLIGAFIGVQIAFWISALIVSWLKRATPEGSMQRSNPIIYGILTWTVELLVWVTLLLVLLSNAGVHIGAFVASLGVGGIALAMAAKNVLEDLFASVAIGLDKPFTVGEFIGFGSELGTVRKVGIKSTRIESLSGEELAINNSNLLQNLVHNYSRREERRIVFEFHVPLDTPRENLPKIAEGVNDIIRAKDMTRLDRGHFLEISRDGYRFEFAYYVLSPDFGPYADIQQSINLAILAELENQGVKLAMPSRVMYDAREGESGTPALSTD